MYVCNTEKLAAMPAVCREQMTHVEHVDAEDVSMIDSFISFFKEKCRGNGRLLLHIFGGHVRDFEPTTRVTKPGSEKKSA